MATHMTGARSGRLGRLLVVVVGLSMFVGWPGGLPVVAAEEMDEETPIGTVWGGRELYEYSSVLIVWDPEAGTYLCGEEEGSFAWLLNLPGTEGWEFVSIMAESWFETTVDDRQAWDVFRWRAVYRRPLELSEVRAE
jgi:hypothetical protein